MGEDYLGQLVNLIRMGWSLDTIDTGEMILRDRERSCEVVGHDLIEMIRTAMPFPEPQSEGLE